MHGIVLSVENDGQPLVLLDCGCFRAVFCVHLIYLFLGLFVTAITVDRIEGMKEYATGLSS